MLSPMWRNISRAVPDLCCLRAENRPTERQSGPPGERNQRVCLYRDPAFKAGPEKTLQDEFAKLQDYRQAEVWNEVTASC